MEPANTSDDSKLSESVMRVCDDPIFRILTSYLQNTPEVSRSGFGRSRSQDWSAQSLFPLHRDRLVASAKALMWQDVVEKLKCEAGLERLTQAVEAHLAVFVGAKYVPFSPRKVRICVDRFGELTIDSNVVENGPLSDTYDGIYLPKDLSSDPLLLRPCKVVLDTTPIEPSLFTTHKTTARAHYNAARERADISSMPPDRGEVLLFNLASEIMEGSVSTPYFLRNGKWITPALKSGGNAGVSRRYAIANGLCVEEIVKTMDLRDQEPVWISNGVRGFIRGALHLTG